MIGGVDTLPERYLCFIVADATSLSDWGMFRWFNVINAIIKFQSCPLEWLTNHSNVKKNIKKRKQKQKAARKCLNGSK